MYFASMYVVNPKVQCYYLHLNSQLSLKVTLITEKKFYLPMQFPFLVFFISLFRFRGPTGIIFLLSEASALTFLNSSGLKIS